MTYRHFDNVKCCKLFFFFCQHCLNFPAIEGEIQLQFSKNVLLILNELQHTWTSA